MGDFCCERVYKGRVFRWASLDVKEFKRGLEEGEFGGGRVRTWGDLNLHNKLE